MKTIKIDIDSIISALFLMGFDIVDTTLLEVLKENIINLDFTINEEPAKFEIRNDEADNILKYLDFDDYVYTLKEGLTLNTKVKTAFREIELQYEFEYLTNKILLSYLNSLNMKNIVAEKISRISHLDDIIFNHFFSSIEKNTVYEILLDSSKNFTKSKNEEKHL